MRYLSLMILLVFVAGCDKDDPKPPVFETPTSVTLIFPFENSACNEGTDVTDTESTVRFEWFSSEFTDEYELIVRNLSSDVMSSFTTSEVSLPVVLQRATPYSWYVISKNNDTDSIARSETWKFYNAGDPIALYAPFPAEAIYPAQAVTINTTGGITLSWQGTDIDDDIVGYDIYFGTTTDPPLLFEDEPDMTKSVSVASGNVYYWRIVSNDLAGHESNSAIFQFKVM